MILFCDNYQNSLKYQNTYKKKVDLTYLPNWYFLN